MMKKIIFSLLLVSLFIVACSETQQSTTTKIQSEWTQSQAQVGPVKEIKVTAKQWEFIPNPIVVNKGDKVRLLITSADVAHGFALPDFDINADISPGQTEVVEFTADKTGSFGFFCSVPCGKGHKDMRGTLIVK